MTRWWFRESLWPTLILLWVGATWLVTFTVPDTLLRPAVVLGFLFICPGMALSRLIRLENSLIELILGITLSIILDSIVACVLLYSGQWSPTMILDILIIVSVAGAMGQLLMGYMLSANIKTDLTETPLPGDIRIQLALRDTFVMPNTPIPVELYERDTIVTRAAPRTSFVAGISEKDTIETPRPPEWKTFSRNLPDMETVAMKQVQRGVVETPRPVPEWDTSESWHIQKQKAIPPRRVPDMETVNMQQVSWRAFVDTHDAEAVTPPRQQQFKAIASPIVDQETVETRQSSLRKTTLRNDR